MAPRLADAEPPIRVAVLASRSDARLGYLLEEDPNRGEAYEVVGGFVNVAESAPISLLAAHDVPVESRDIHDFYDDRGAPLEDLDVRETFDAHVADALAGFDPDLVVLAGYLHILTAPVLDRFHPHIVNSHHGDLTIRDESGNPVYSGLRSVENAIRHGEADTRETTHVVTEKVDRGPLIARSRPFSVHRDLVDNGLDRDDDDLLGAYVYAHRRWMIREGGGPTLAKTIELVADGRVTYADGDVTVDGDHGYYQLGEGAVTTTPPEDLDSGFPE